MKMEKPLTHRVPVQIADLVNLIYDRTGLPKQSIVAAALYHFATHTPAEIQKSHSDMVVYVSNRSEAMDMNRPVLEGPESGAARPDQESESASRCDTDRTRTDP